MQFFYISNYQEIRFEYIVLRPRPYTQAESQEEKREKDGKQYSGAVGGVVFPMVSGGEGGKGDATEEYGAAVKQ